MISRLKKLSESVRRAVSPVQSEDKRMHKFSERARMVLTLSQEEAQRLNHNYIEPEHLLLGLLLEGEGVAARVLSGLSIDLTEVRSAVEFIIGRGEQPAREEIGLTPRAKKVVELAVDEARRMNHTYIGTEHLLIGLLREGKGPVAGVLESLGANLEKVRAETERVLSVSGGSGSTGGLIPTQWRRTGWKFDKFSERARMVLTLSQEEAQRLNHNYIEPEHLLLGLLLEGEGVAARVLSGLSIDLTEVRSAVEFIIGRGEQPAREEIGLMPRAKKVVELAVDEARRMNHTYIGTEHLLIGLLREGKGPVAGVLESLGANLEKVRVETERVLSVSGGSGSTGGLIPTQWRRTGWKFDKFSERARMVLTLSQEEAQRLNHNYIEPEHLLLGLLLEGEGVAARVLSGLSIDLTEVRSAVEFIIGRGEQPARGEIGLTPRVMKVVELAVDEARRMNHTYIGTEHLLIGLLREGEGLAAGVLESLGANLEKVRAKTERVLSVSGGDAPPVG